MAIHCVVRDSSQLHEGGVIWAVPSTPWLPGSVWHRTGARNSADRLEQVFSSAPPLTASCSVCSGGRSLRPPRPRAQNLPAPLLMRATPATPLLRWPRQPQRMAGHAAASTLAPAAWSAATAWSSASMSSCPGKVVKSRCVWLRHGAAGRAIGPRGDRRRPNDEAPLRQPAMHKSGAAARARRAPLLWQGRRMPPPLLLLLSCCCCRLRLQAGTPPPTPPSVARDVPLF
jgi:hypothetical protein